MKIFIGLFHFTILVLLMVVSAFIAINSNMGERIYALGIILWAIFAVVYLEIISFINNRYNDIKYRYKKCKHGITGAIRDCSLCPECAAENKRMIEEQAKKREFEKAEAKRKELEEYNEWAKNVRLNEYLLKMRPEKFEELACNLFEKIGYTTELTPRTGDHGVDAYLYNENEKIVLQCKRVKNSVGEPVIRDLYGAVHDTKSNSAIIVTTGKVSQKAREWIKDKPIRIIELDELRRLISEHFPLNVMTIPDIKPIVGQSMFCPKCGNRLRIINGRRGPFLGCISYPRCNYTRSVSINKPWK